MIDQDWIDNWEPVMWVSGKHAGNYYERTGLWKSGLGHPDDCEGCLYAQKMCKGEPIGRNSEVLQRVVREEPEISSWHDDGGAVTARD